MLRILIIDPHDDFREILGDVLNWQGIETRGLRGMDVESVKAWAPNAALVATELFDDERAGRALRESLPSLRYVVGMVSDQFSRRGMFECNRLVTKPFDASALLRHIEQHLRVGEARN